MDGTNATNRGENEIPPLLTEVSEAKFFRFIRPDKKDVMMHTSVSDMLWRNTNSWPRYVRDLGDMLLKRNILSNEPRSCGVLIDGKVYNDDRIFWIDGFLESWTNYPLVYEKPEEWDRALIRRDRRKKVPYANDYPSCDFLHPDTPIIYTNIDRWEMIHAPDRRWEKEKKARQQLLMQNMASVDEYQCPCRSGCRPHPQRISSDSPPPYAP